MIKTVLIALICFTGITLQAQDIEVDKTTGLIKVDGSDAFYLVKRKNGLTSDLSLQNLAHEELAYLMVRTVDELPPYERGNHVGTYYLMTFSETANTAKVFPEGFALVKNVAKQLINANLIKNQRIDYKAEKAFVVSHFGMLLREPEPIQVNINAPATSAPSANIVIKEDRIYNHDEFIGSFKQQLIDGLTTITVYDKGDGKVALATHADGDPQADWNITVLDNGKSYQSLYNANQPLEKLFRFITDKGILH